ncbi:lanthionine synthetase C family protein [Chryseobacterium tructae]|uniref:Lanthionine synthetase C family protein n=1 Tax=Chryseobacterium tructae TaxID=1037380 RepID=A0ABV7XW78_9FLAO|nr:lanthionine synthetase C family protein [Chryseobacterium tructae]MDN3692978.1 lanthionine synthetase C family protein [Chryseobacterium tructae]
MEQIINITDEKQNEIESLLLQIAKRIVEKNKSIDLGLFSGSMGEILFLHEYSKINHHYQKYIPDHIDHLFESIEKGNVFHSYCSGLAGVCLGIDYIESETNPEYERFDFVDDQIHNWLISQLDSCIKGKDYDFLHGAVGIGFYFLERYKSGDHALKKALHQLLEFLNDSAIRENDKIKWKNESQEVNISMSHGMVSIILFVLEVYKADFQTEYNLSQLIQGAVRFILAQEIDPTVYHSYYPYTSIENEKENLKGSRLSWCYGDLGIAVMLRKVSEVFNNNLWMEKSTEILEFSTLRTDSSIRVVDAGICHGSSGVALMFYNEFLQTGNEKYAEAAKYWMDITFDFYKEDPENFSRVAYDPLNKGYTAKECFLEGTSGVGLVLLSMRDGKTDWLKFLLL